MSNSAKMKGHKGLKKRIKLTGRNKVKFARPGKNHINSHMDGTTLRDKRNKIVVKKGDRKLIEKLLHVRIQPSNVGPATTPANAD
ncbi:large ribosomal subunit protein bL35 [Algisphaera agarilytica]|uniref:50S ribosomal protein L35 n=1 Tax=Algisphaera agarilytica TaxID=1385975 RepID=A0A7X0LL26_9BACT|nr:50S ribosomal protein L35 [Algisphaera agarilytica]MBB6430216.1 large subunit ribosomal protein L35 [Algisphaera agarilytica]